MAIDSSHECYEVVRNLYLALNLDRARLRLVGVSLENLQSDASEQLTLGARDKGWREAEGAADRAQARFGPGSVKPARLLRKKSEKSD